MVAGPLAGRAGGRAARHRRGQRRRPAGGLGCRCGRAGALGRRPACAGSSMRWAAPRARAASRFADGGWACATGCGFARPDPDGRRSRSRRRRAATHGGVGRRAEPTAVDLALPGRFNHANALMAAVAAGRWASTPSTALAAMADGRRGGRPLHHPRRGGRAGPAHAGQEPRRLERAPRPGGGRTTGRSWSASTRGSADGADPSWLWDVPFERLAGRGGGDRGSVPRPLGAAAVRRGGPRCEPEPVPAVARGGRRRRRGADVVGRRDRQLHRLRRSPRGRVRDAASAAHRGGLPRPARHLWRRRERGDPGPAGRVARARGRAACRPLGRRRARGGPLLPGRRRGRPQVRAARSLDRRRHAGPTGAPRRGRPGRVRRLPDRGPQLSREPTARRTRASACWMSTP